MNTNLIEKVQGMYAAFSRGDIAAVMEEIAVDASWGIDTVAAAEVPWYGVINGKANIPKFFQALAEGVEFTAFNPHDFVTAGDQVFNHLAYEGRVKTTGTTVKGFAMQHWTLRDGRVIRWRSYEDTALIRDALRK